MPDAPDAAPATLPEHLRLDAELREAMRAHKLSILQWQLCLWVLDWTTLANDPEVPIRSLAQLAEILDTFAPNLLAPYHALIAAQVLREDERGSKRAGNRFLFLSINRHVPEWRLPVRPGFPGAEGSRARAATAALDQIARDRAAITGQGQLFAPDITAAEWNAQEAEDRHRAGQGSASNPLPDLDFNPPPSDPGDPELRYGNHNDEAGTVRTAGRPPSTTHPGKSAPQGGHPGGPRYGFHNEGQHTDAGAARAYAPAHTPAHGPARARAPHARQSSGSKQSEIVKAQSSSGRRATAEDLTDDGRELLARVEAFAGATGPTDLYRDAWIGRIRCRPGLVERALADVGLAFREHRLSGNRGRRLAAFVAEHWNDAEKCLGAFVAATVPTAAKVAVSVLPSLTEEDLTAGRRFEAERQARRQRGGQGK